MRQTAIQFYSGGMAVEGVLAIPEPGVSKPALIIICHPHPALGGDMESSVVVAVCRAAASMGLASLRFNFRGVGASEGRFTGGPGERDDLVAAAAAMRRWPGISGRRIAVAGYSFGAGVALSAMGRLKGVRAAAAIAPPVSSVRILGNSKLKTPTLIAAGSRDGIAPPEAIRRELEPIAGPVRFEELAGADHSLAGREGAVAALVAEFLAGSLR